VFTKQLLRLLVDPFVVANAEIALLAVPSVRLVSSDLAGLLSSAELILLPAFNIPYSLSSAESFLLLAFDLPCFLGPNSGFAFRYCR
jgi:hypothetical protein